MKDETSKELTEIEDNTNTQTKIIRQYYEEFEVEKEKEKAILRNIIHAERKLEELAARKKELVVKITLRQA